MQHPLNWHALDKASALPKIAVIAKQDTLDKIAVALFVVVFHKTLYTKYALAMVSVSHQMFVFVIMDTLVHTVVNMVAEQHYTGTQLQV